MFYTVIVQHAADKLSSTYSSKCFFKGG